MHTITLGITEPIKVKLENDVIAIVKTYNNIQGNLVLINEYVSHKLANALLIKTAPSGICILDENTSIPPELEVIKADKYGYGFYSTYLDKAAVLKEGVVQLLHNKEMFYSLLLFDHIIYNKDRNIYNLLVTYEKKCIEFVLIDHSHVFKNETIWDAQCFKNGILDYDIKDKYILDSNERMYEMFYRNMKFEPEKLYETAEYQYSIITEELLNIIFNEIPGEWYFNHNDLIELKNYILYRSKNIYKICDMIYEYMKLR